MDDFMMTQIPIEFLSFKIRYIYILFPLYNNLVYAILSEQVIFIKKKKNMYIQE